MKSRRIFTHWDLCGAVLCLAVCLAVSSAWADWGPPPSEGCGPGGGCAPSPNYAMPMTPYSMPMMPYGGGMMDCGDASGCDGYGGMSYPPMDGGMHQGYGCGPQTAGLAAGCPPVGFLGRLGAITGLGASAGCGASGGCGPGGAGGGLGGAGCRIGDNGVYGCSRNGYNRGAYPKPFGPYQEPVNPYESYPGIGPMGDYINLGDVCCGPHWYDVMVEAVFLQRDGDANVGLSSEGPRGLGQPNLVLSTSDLDTGLNTGLRVAGRLQMNAVDSIEAVYLGGVDWSDTQTRISNFNDLYSVYSDFGVDPLGGFEDTDQATLHSVSLNSDLDSIEINCRRDWIGRHHRTSGALLMGCRYMRFRDRFRFATVVEEHIDAITNPMDPTIFGPGSSLYDVTALNNMLGVQGGGELVVCVFPGFTIGTEGKLGILGNNTGQNTSFRATTGLVDFTESRSITIATYYSDVQAFFLWQFHPLAKLRGGYEALYLNHVATGATNFNPQDVFGTRLPILRADEELLFHGFHVGLELGW